MRRLRGHQPRTEHVADVRCIVATIGSEQHQRRLREDDLDVPARALTEVHRRTRCIEQAVRRDDRATDRHRANDSFRARRRMRVPSERGVGVLPDDSKSLRGGGMRAALEQRHHQVRTIELEVERRRRHRAGHRVEGTTNVIDRARKDVIAHPERRLVERVEKAAIARCEEDLAPAREQQLAGATRHQGKQLCGLITRGDIAELEGHGEMLRRLVLAAVLVRRFAESLERANPFDDRRARIRCDPVERLEIERSGERGGSW